MSLGRAELRLALAQSFVVGIGGQSATPEDMELFGRHGLGGVILFSRNISSPRQVHELNSALCQSAQEAGRSPLFVTVDQEGGSVARLKEPFTHQPDMRELGSSGQTGPVAGFALRLGQELKAAGFNWDLAPVLDVHAIENGIMASRSLGSDPKNVARLGHAFIEAMQSQGVLACAKHFPGLGRTTKDTHLERPEVDISLAELSSLELIPFEQAVQAKAAGIMVCHAVFIALDPEQPASLSPKIIQDLLRQKLGYQGLVLSDDLEMGAVVAGMETDQAAVRAYQAGCDLLLVCHRPQMALSALDELVNLVERGVISQQRVSATLARIQKAKANLAHLPGPYTSLKEILKSA